MEATAVDFNKKPDGAEVADPDSLEAGRTFYDQSAAAAAAQMRPDPADESLMVEFYRSPIDDRDHVRIRIPGDKLYQPDFIADDHYKMRFAKQWQAYAAGLEQFAGQTMLTDVAWIDEGMRDHMGGFGVKTVEALAGLSDGNMDAMGPGTRGLRDKARRQVETKAKAAETDELRAEMAAMRAEMAAMRETPKPPRGRGKG